MNIDKYKGLNFMEKIKDINRLNDVFFKSLLGSKERKNLTKCERKAPKFIYGDISSLKNNDSISLFFIVLYF